MALENNLRQIVITALASMRANGLLVTSFLLLAIHDERREQIREKATQLLTTLDEFDQLLREQQQEGE